MWKGERVVSEEWIDKMTAPRFDSYDGCHSFGYQWWFHKRLRVSFMNGHGGQYACIDGDTETIVVLSSEPNTQDDFQIREEQGTAILEDIMETLRCPGSAPLRTPDVHNSSLFLTAFFSLAA